MIAMLTLSENYTFIATEKNGKQFIDIFEVKTRRMKTFESVGKSLTGLINHMSSMTEDTCKPYFPKEK